MMQSFTGMGMSGQSGVCYSGVVIMAFCESDARYGLFTIDFLFRRAALVQASRSCIRFIGDGRS